MSRASRVLKKVARVKATDVDPYTPAEKQAVNFVIGGVQYTPGQIYTPQGKKVKKPTGTAAIASQIAKDY